MCISRRSAQSAGVDHRFEARMELERGGEERATVLELVEPHRPGVVAATVGARGVLDAEECRVPVGLLHRGCRLLSRCPARPPTRPKQRLLNRRSF